MNLWPWCKKEIQIQVRKIYRIILILDIGRQCKSVELYRNPLVLSIEKLLTRIIFKNVGFLWFYDHKEIMCLLFQSTRVPIRILYSAFHVSKRSRNSRDWLYILQSVQFLLLMLDNIQFGSKLNATLKPNGWLV